MWETVTSLGCHLPPAIGKAQLPVWQDYCLVFSFFSTHRLLWNVNDYLAFKVDLLPREFGSIAET